MAGTRLTIACVLVLLSVAQSAVKKLPPYITACSRSDPNLNDCIVKNANAAIPVGALGDPKYRIPSMDPLVIPELQITEGTDAVGLKLLWKNAEIHGIKDVKMTYSDFNLATKHAKFEYFCPKIRIAGIYTASGKVLVLPVTGHGPSNVTVENLKLSFVFDWKLRKKANGKEFLEIVQHEMTLLDLRFMSLKFDNLFNGDRLLGENMNTFMNENWRELAKDVGPAVTPAIGDVFKLVFNNICDIVPFDIVFKP